MSMIEIAVAVTALAVTAAGIMAAMIGGIGGSQRHREHATATAWLQSAADYLEISPMEVCGTAASVGAVYQEDVRANVGNSDGWDSAHLTVTDVQFWNGSSFGSTCYEDLQLVTIGVSSPNGEVTSSLTVVKSNPYVELDSLPVASDSFASCSFETVTLSSNKSGVVTAGTPILVALKKPSDTKVSAMKDDDVRVVLKTDGNCSGKLRIQYQYPHNDHFHTRKVSLKLLKGTTDTYVGKLGGGKYYRNATIDLTVQQGRTKSKTWGTITGGQLNDWVKFV